jgi:hypothetical protein
MMGEVVDFRGDTDMRIADYVQQSVRYRDTFAKLTDETNSQRSKLGKEQGKTQALEDRLRSREQAQ